ncbi:MAG: FtsK/SpoIIIE domain-containing protein [Xenococcaceae cyanobacterium MO_188.B19]|nr:FtsK/SpoIIIE domain-containing protein [Xenococcaceae cyanobacterium MO_188.B19]
MNLVKSIRSRFQLGRDINELRVKILEIENAIEAQKVKFEEDKKNQIIRLKKQIAFEAAQLEHKISQLKVEKEQQYKQYLSQAELELSKVAAYTELARQKATEDAPRLLEEEWDRQNKKLTNLRNNLDGLTDYSQDTPPRLISLPWNDLRWTPNEKNFENYRPQMSGIAPDIIRIGEFHSIGTLNHLKKSDFPAIIPIRASSADSNIHQPGHIAIFSNDAASREAALAAIQSIALRAIATFPVLKLKGIFLDPVGMGNNFPFKNLPEKIRGLKTYTRGDDIQEQLRSLNLHIEQVIQNYLGKHYETLDEFNKEAYVKQAYHYLFATDFPTFFDNKSWEDLKSLLVNGARAGVYAVIHIDETLEKPRSFDYQVFHDYCRVLQPSKNYSENIPLFTTALPNGLANDIELDVTPSNEQFNQIAQKITEAAKNIKTETVPFKELYPTGEEWSFDSRKEIRAPIGIAGAIDRLEFWMGENDDGQVVSNGLLAGKPGAGKSYTLHAIINSLVINYSPDELEMYLLDFKEGVEFQIYVDPDKSDNNNADEELNEANALPHAKVISIESDREFGLSVLQHVQAEIDKRGSIFKDVGVSDIKTYRKKTKEIMPRVLVVIDEFQYMFKESDHITRQLNGIYEDITRRGRAFGIHLLIASQSPNVSNMNSSIYSYIELRMAQQMDKRTAASVLAEGNTDAIDLADRPGKVIYNCDFGRKSRNDIGQVADISLETRIDTLRHIQKVAKQRNYQRREPLVLFNGSKPTKLSHNRQLVQLSQMDRWLSSKDLNKQVVNDRDWVAQESPGVAWLGEAMKIGDHTKAIFRRRSRSNMLIVGTSEETIFGILGGILISLIHCYKPKQAQFNIIDLAQDEDNHWIEMCQNFRDNFDSMFDITLGKRFPDPDNRIKKAEEILKQTYVELEQRQTARDEHPDEFDSKPPSPLFFIYALGSINRAQNLRPISGRRGDELSEDAQKLEKLISQGSELGIHTILWVDNMKTLEQLTADKVRSWLGNLDLRIGLKMPAKDSQDLFKENNAQNLPDLRAYFRDESTTNGLEKFKPYAVPLPEELEEYGKRLKQR